MKLNKECIRYLLLYIEENAQLNDDTIDVLNIIDSGFSTDDLVYTAIKLKEAGYINGLIKFSDDEIECCYISSLTWNGHSFLDNIRDNNVWKTTKEIVNKFSSVSVSIINSVASQVILKLIEKQLGQ